MKLPMIVCALSVFITSAAAGGEEQLLNKDVEPFCPSDPVTCLLTRHTEFDCREGVNPLLCWFGTYRDPQKPYRYIKQQGWGVDTPVPQLRGTHQ